MNVHKKIKNGWIGWLLCDVLAIVLAYYFTLYLRFLSETGVRVFGWMKWLLGEGAEGDIGVSHFHYFIEAAPLILPVLTVTLVVFYGLNNMYDQHRFLRSHSLAWDCILANGGMLIVGTLFLYMTRRVYQPRSFLPAFACINVSACLLCRHSFQSAIDFLNTRFGIGRKNVLLIGNSLETSHIAAVINGYHPKGLYLKKVVDERCRFLHPAQTVQLENLLMETQADMLIVGYATLGVAEIMNVLDVTSRLDVTAKILTRELDILHRKAGLRTDIINGIPLVHFDAPSLSSKDNLFRHALSLLLALVALLLATPVFLIAALLVKAEDGGPVFFLQERIGVNRKPFKIIKFRTMHVDAERMLDNLEALNEQDSGLFKIKRDPRITRVGRVLRRLSIDELPQLLNVLKGDMRIVGPRPLPRRDFENYYEEWHYARHMGVPGLTCLWQVSGRSEIDFHNMCILDLYYLRNTNWALDLKIVLRTVWVVLFGRGAY